MKRMFCFSLSLTMTLVATMVTCRPASAQAPLASVRAETAVKGIPFTMIPVYAGPNNPPNFIMIPGQLQFNEKVTVTGEHKVFLKNNSTSAIVGQVQVNWTANVSYTVTSGDGSGYSVRASGGPYSVGAINDSMSVNIAAGEEFRLVNATTPAGGSEASYTPQMNPNPGYNASLSITGNALTDATVKGIGILDGGSFTLTTPSSTKTATAYWATTAPTASLFKTKQRRMIASRTALHRSIVVAVAKR